MAKEKNDTPQEDDDLEGLDLPDIDEEMLNLEDDESDIEETEEESDDESLLKEEASLSTEEEETLPQAPAAKPTPPPQKAQSDVKVAPPSEPISREEVSLPLTIEVGRIQIPLSQLLSLESGNTLEIGIAPEQGVNLVIDGRSIGKGELIRVGGKIGVRILEIS